MHYQNQLFYEYLHANVKFYFVEINKNQKWSEECLNLFLIYNFYFFHLAFFDDSSRYVTHAPPLASWNNHMPLRPLAFSTAFIFLHFCGKLKNMWKKLSWLRPITFYTLAYLFFVVVVRTIIQLKLHISV